MKKIALIHDGESLKQTEPTPDNTTVMVIEDDFLFCFESMQEMRDYLKSLPKLN